MSRGGRVTSTPAWGDRVLPAVFFLATAAAAIQPLRSYDLWWHLASGRFMVAAGKIPGADPFSFTRPGFPWLDHEWLFQLLAYAGYSAGGWLVLLLGTVALCLTSYFLLWNGLPARAKSSGAAWMLLALSLAGARFRFDFRPEMVSYPFLAALAIILLRSRRSEGHWMAWMLFPLFAIWANVHPAALLGAAVLVLYLAGEWIDDRALSRGERRSPARIALALASVLALLLNPGGWRLLRVPMEIRAIVVSGHAPNQEWLAPTFADFPLFFASVVVSALVLLGSVGLFLLQARRAPDGTPGNAAASSSLESSSMRQPTSSRGEWIRWGPVLVLALLAWMGMQQLRNIGFFFVALPLALAPPVSWLLEKGRIPSAATKLLGAVTLTILIPLFLSRAPVSSREEFLAPVAPARAVEFLQQNQVGARLFNDVKFGGYLIWRRFPDHPVFIDGRNEIYDSLLAEIFQALGSWEGWEAMLRRYRIDAAMLRRGQVQAVEYPPTAAGQRGGREMRAFSAAYFQRSQWALVYWDDQALIFVRRDDPAYARLLEGEYRIVNPDDVPHLLQQIQGSQVRREEALKEVDRKLAEDPGCLSALSVREQILALRDAAGS